MRKYWFILNDTRMGPYTLDDSRGLPLRLSTPVWYDGLADWTVIGELPEAQLLLGNMFVPPPTPTPPPAPTDIPREVVPPTPSEGATPPDPATDEGVERSERTIIVPPTPAQQEGAYEESPEEEAEVDIEVETTDLAEEEPLPAAAAEQDVVVEQVEEQIAFGPEPALPPLPQEACPPNFLVWNIVCTLLCCMPIGVVGIIFSSKVSTAYRVGDLERARKYSERAEWCVILSISLGLLLMPLQWAVQAMIGL